MMKCLSCGSNELELVLQLCNTPWCNDFRKTSIPKSEFYPLDLYMCKQCSLVQIGTIVPKEKMFSEHTYVSGTTKTLAQHFYDLAKENVNQFNLRSTDLIVDIGGNDGTNLLQYKKLEMYNLCNVESANNIAQISANNGIYTLNNFFSEQFVNNTFAYIDEIKKISVKAKLINASGVFFHLEEIHSVLKGIKKLLDEEGVFIIQFMYLKDILDNLAFDAIYHEHLCYYNLHSLQNLLDQYDLEIFDAYRSEIHGGSVMAKVVHKNSYKNVKTLRYFNLWQNDIITIDQMKNFGIEVERIATKIHKFMTDLKSTGVKIYGLGAPAKSTTLLNYCNIDNNILDKLVEINDLKVGLLSPGTNIPIEKESEDDVPYYYFITAWNFAKEIIEKNKHLIEKGVKFIKPLPVITIIDKDNL